MEIRRLTSAEVEPVIEQLRAEGLPAEDGDGIWLGAVKSEDVLGTGRILERAGIHMLEDVWVSPAHRERGLAGSIVAAAKARHRPLWLICDEDMVGYYERRGFAAQPAEAFPPAFAELYASKGEWPGRGHLHVAMCWGDA
jgi:GNAT superfamily N-acetyltransferase